MTRQLRLAALWCAAVALATGLAYFAVLAALRGTPEPSPARAQLADARRVDDLAAGLRTLLDQVAGPGAGPAPRLPVPMLAELRAKVRQSQQEILRVRLAGPAYDALLAAADRLAACAGAPQNETLCGAAQRTQAELELLTRTEIERLQRAVERDRDH